jgi:multidrug efflux pump subunit AcrA (membrane-fusion protein)
MSARGGAIVAIAVVMLTACHHSKPVEEASEPAQPIAVKAEVPKKGKIAEVLAAMGETAAISTLRLGSPIAGRVTYLTAQPGDAVSQGDVLARVLSLENEAALTGFAMLRSSPSEAAATPRPLEREIGSRAVAVRAPLAGVVVERLHNPGEQVPQGEALLELFDPRSLVAIAQVPAESAARIERGMPVELAGAGFRGSGRVESVAAALVPGALTVPVRITFADPKPTRMLHAALDCRITLALHDQALLIPASALLESTHGESGAVLVVADGKATRKAITIGLRAGNDVEVVGGLEAADRVIVDGYGRPDGTAVTVEEPKPPEGAT